MRSRPLVEDDVEATVAEQAGEAENLLLVLRRVVRVRDEHRRPLDGVRTLARHLEEDDPVHGAVGGFLDVSKLPHDHTELSFGQFGAKVLRKLLVPLFDRGPRIPDEGSEVLLIGE